MVATCLEGKIKKNEINKKLNRKNPMIEQDKDTFKYSIEGYTNHKWNDKGGWWRR